MPEENPLIKGKPLDIIHVLELEDPNAGVESPYFWILNFLRNNQPSGCEFRNIEKIKDIYNATESSAYFGMIEQRKSIQQEKVSQYLATLGKMTKDLFQIVREMRIMDERGRYYVDINSGDESAAIALKSIWIDQVEGGAKNPGSVLGLASRDIGFITLPDLFFKMNPVLTEEERKDKKKRDVRIDQFVDKATNNYGLNSKIKELLKRKLYQFYVWKESTEKEITTRRRFVLAYLNQHYQTMRLYINWIRPYLKNVQALQMDNLGNKPELVRAFNTTKIELELLAASERDFKGDNEKKKWEANKLYRAFVRIKFDYTAIPQMAYQNEQQRGAIHMGLTKIHIEAYALTKNQVDEYRKSIEKEDLEIIASLNSAMESMGKELTDYLDEAKDVTAKEKKSLLERYDKSIKILKHRPEPDIDSYTHDELKKIVERLEKQTVKAANKIDFSLLSQPIKDLKDMTKNISSGFKFLIGKNMDVDKIDKDVLSQKSAEGTAKAISFLIYDVYKKAHRMMSW